MKIINERESVTLSKKYIKNVNIYDDMIVIYVNRFAAYVIPTRYLDEEAKECIMKQLDI